ncbi:hypothetical protein EPUS_03570 [Endocarpon pusillum Z07020]|uniref:Uncharacterized protein n=1 Tax=Endocarpon pusillum (strain Z07020 / HMAS-L-300199) TaxID=1263415 RepID=U1GD66_ENDPU|nr:uncharacterized protein EPUS_03570 [Endocarpon pusillum Z07020]ERF70018.1 hypothetical protein EPUS_03570 [Endocarpon pusillum Z07020]
MKFTLALLPFILGMAVAAPAPEARADVEARQTTTVSLTFYGADVDARYSIAAPTDGSEFTINHPEISVSRIYNAGGATCYIYGSEGSYTFVPVGEHPVGPPQPQWEPVHQSARPSSNHSDETDKPYCSTPRSFITDISVPSGPLRTNPFGYTVEMHESFGVVPYLYDENGSDDPDTVEDLDLVATYTPSNLKEIQTALQKDRDDLPGKSHFRTVASMIAENALNPKEPKTTHLFNTFLNPTSRKGRYGKVGKETWIIPEGMLPSLQRRLEPDLSIGIAHEKLGMRVWSAKHLPGHIKNRQMICVNGVVEYKTEEGSIARARVQNLAAATLACDAWLADENFLTNGKGAECVVGKAFVGSICFDGNVIEASVHWLAPSVTSSTRKYDTFSMRVATGHPFSLYLSEFRACYQKFANFLDWIRDVQQVRLQDILKLPPSEPENLSLPQPDDGLSEDEEDTSGQEDKDLKDQQMKREDVQKEDSRVKDKKSENQKKRGKKGKDEPQGRTRSHKSRIGDDAVSKHQADGIRADTPTKSPQIAARIFQQDSETQKKKKGVERKRQPRRGSGQGTAQADSDAPGRKRMRRG